MLDNSIKNTIYINIRTYDHASSVFLDQNMFRAKLCILYSFK